MLLVGPTYDVQSELPLTEQEDEEGGVSKLILLKHRLGLESLDDADLVRLIEKMHGA